MGSADVSAAATSLGAHREGCLPEAQMLHVRRTGKETSMIEVPVKRDSMTEGDCFILADGRTIYKWYGQQSSPFEKNACALHAENLARDRHGTVARPDSRFWSLLGADGPVWQTED